MTGSVVRTCPKCLTRVMPLESGLCPACRQFDFNTSPADEKTVATAKRASEVASAVLVRRAASLHWRVMWAFGLAMVAVLLRFYVRIGGLDDLAGGLDRGLVGTVLSVGAAVALVVAWSAARQLAAVIRLAAPGRPTPNLLTILKESKEFFREKRVPVGFFGPQVGRTSETVETRPE